MMIRLANQSFIKPHQKPKKKRPELTLVTVTTRNDVDIEPGYHRGADHYLITSTFGTHRLYSLTVNRQGFTPALIVDDVMKRLRQAAGWTKLVDHGVTFEPVATDTGDITLLLGSSVVGCVQCNGSADYTLVLDRNLDPISRDTLSSVIHEQLTKELSMAADDSHYPAPAASGPVESIDAVKQFMVAHEQRLGYKLNWDEWQALLEDAYDELAEEEDA